MSDRPQDENWWLASDGRWYPPETQPGEPLPPPPAASPRISQTYVSKGLTYLAFGLLLATSFLFLVYTVATIGFLLAYRSGSGAGRGVQLQDLAVAEEIYYLALGLATLAFVACGVVFIIWMYRAYRAVSSREPVGNNWSPGWAIGAWFIPLAHWVIPRLVLGEVERMSHPATGAPPIGDRWKESPIEVLGRIWWVSFISANILWWTSANFQGYFLSDTAIERWVGVEIVAGFLYVIAAVLGALYVRRVGPRLGPP